MWKYADSQVFSEKRMHTCISVYPRMKTTQHLSGVGEMRQMKQVSALGVFVGWCQMILFFYDITSFQFFQMGIWGGGGGY